MRIKRALLVLPVLILALPSIYGIGIGLFVDEVNFEPNLNTNFNAFVNNNMGYNAKVRLIVNGGLAQYVTFPEEYVDIPAGQRYFFTFNLKLPESISPGRNRIDIGAEDVTSAGGGGIVARTAAYGGFYVRAPYPGKYIEASFGANDIGENETLTFSANVISRGNETIDNIGGLIEVFAQEDKIDAIAFEPIKELKPGESRTMSAKWSSRSNPAGEYTAKADIDYDGQLLTFNAKFKIGALLVKIINYTKEFYKDQINRFDVEIESAWNSKITDIYGEIEVGKERIKTLKTDLMPWGRTKITAYLDTANIPLGISPASIKVYHGGRISEENAQIVVFPKKERIIELPSEMPDVTKLLVAIIILLVVGNILLIVYMIRREKRQPNKGMPGKGIKRK